MVNYHLGVEVFPASRFDKLCNRMNANQAMNAEILNETISFQGFEKKKVNYKKKRKVGEENK